MREDGIGADQLVLAGDQRPGRGEVVVIFAVDDRIGTRFAELGLFERADVGRVGGFGNRLGEACGDLVAVEARSEEHTSELQSLMRISYAVFCLKKKTSNRSKTLS